ncbi:hypothetical protein VTL71DRAFT_832 [Oculimacula yallundae]|uniref:Uncharacterized protein n=1 Tax=Oculimacula yallundae TaxID=86028 RepID=A0ABR4D3H2_9HELO
MADISATDKYGLTLEFTSKDTSHEDAIRRAALLVELELTSKPARVLYFKIKAIDIIKDEVENRIDILIIQLDQLTTYLADLRIGWDAPGHGRWEGRAVMMDCAEKEWDRVDTLLTAARGELYCIGRVRHELVAIQGTRREFFTHKEKVVDDDDDDA